jgi:hypothetical protein
MSAVFNTQRVGGNAVFDSQIYIAASAGALTTSAFKNNTGQLLPNLSGLTVAVLNATTLAFVKTFTGQVTNASGVMSITDPLFVSGAEYIVVTKNTDGTAIGAEKHTAS